MDLSKLAMSYRVKRLISERYYQNVEREYVAMAIMRCFNNKTCDVYRKALFSIHNTTNTIDCCAMTGDSFLMFCVLQSRLVILSEIDIHNIQLYSPNVCHQIIKFYPTMWVPIMTFFFTGNISTVKIKQIFPDRHFNIMSNASNDKIERAMQSPSLFIIDELIRQRVQNVIRRQTLVDLCIITINDCRLDLSRFPIELRTA
jgi:hypothetical protein